MNKKRCTKCGKWKTSDHFEDRKDSWYLWSWCHECRRFERRDIITPEQQEYMNKTDVFVLK